MNASNPEDKVPLVACLGEVLIDFISEEKGSLDSVASFRKHSGGAPANVAVGISRLGVTCGFIGKVGSDTFGEFLKTSLKENGINIEGIVETKEAPTALAFVSRSITGERHFIFYRDPCADVLLTEDDLPKDWLRKIKYLHVGGVSLTRNPSRQTTLRAIEIARKNGAVITFDPNLRLDLWSGGLHECRKILHIVLARTDIFLPSQHELLLIMDTEQIDDAFSRAHKLGPHTICLKCGADGSRISTKTAKGKYDQFSQKALDVNVVDTTGAGDGFNAGLIVGLVKGMNIREAVRQGTAVASLVITKIGAMTALPTEQELSKFLMKMKAD
ncbi:MAG: carbohydrate kinase [Candidatus Hermodarchaeota archaeon]|nr:carbohydrate kinase [Candidatus Hermodarchaeota archaeon]